MGGQKSVLSATMLWLLASAALADNRDIPRTPEGKPDFQGLWTNETQTPLERPTALGDKRAYTPEEAAQRVTESQERFERDSAPIDPNREAPEKGAPIGLEADWKFPDSNVVTVLGEARTSLVIEPANGRIPLQPGPAQDWRSLQLAKPGVEEFDGPEIRTVGERCLLSVLSTAGPPMVPMAYNSNYQIVQTPQYLMIMTEMVNDVRIIRIDGQPLPEGMVRWMGDSVAHWEGDTLVVHTDKVHPQQSFRGSTGAMTTTEWFSMESPQQINYRVTLHDPAAYTQDWTAEVPLRALPADSQLYEYACHEGNSSVTGSLAGARRQEHDARLQQSGEGSTEQ
ncbi:MAG: hypothetical protein H7A05_03535 [Pseudomonadales bacterium]|nr:hypothetical protein [Pseudomonadales bacterium]MCP5343669.1 hypothetical protein [Pseudomonadales bacterium]